MENIKIDRSEEDPRVVAVIEEMLNKVRDIIDRFEDIVHDVWNIYLLAKELFNQVKILFQGEGQGAEPRVVPQTVS